VPGRLRHRAPLLALSADVEAAMPPAGQRRFVAAGPAPDLQHGSIRAARVDEDAHSVPNGELVAADQTALFAEGERPGRAAGAESEGAFRLERGLMLARWVLTARRGGHGKHGVVPAVPRSSQIAGRRPGAAGGDRRRQGKRQEDYASRAARPDDERRTGPSWHRVAVHQAPR